MGRLIHEYSEWLQARSARPRTVEQRVRFAAARMEEWGTRWPEDAAVLARWLSQRSGWTALTDFNHLRSYYQFLLDTGRVTVDPTQIMRRPSKPKARPRPLTPAEVRTVLEGTSGRMRAWAMLGLYAGLRIHESVKLDGRDVTETRIYVVGKGGHAATVPTHPLIWQLAQEYPRIGLWFPDASDLSRPYRADYASAAMGKKFRRLGIGSGSSHRLRATYGTMLLRNGENMRVIQELLRHDSLTSTMHYLGVDEDECADAIRGLAA